MFVLKKFTILASMVLLLLSQVACDRTVTVVESVQPTNCFACHNDQDTFLVSAEQQWNNSLHASGFNVNRGTSASCAGCHSSEGFIERTKDEEVTGHDNPTVIHCFTCHAPHSTASFNLRVNDPQMLANGVSEDIKLGNMCVSCHQALQDVNTYVDIGTVTFTSEHWGPHHGTQGDNFFASNGFEYDGFNYLDMSYHRQLTTDGCLDCHLRVTRNGQPVERSQKTEG